MSDKKPQKLVRFDWAMKNILRDKANFDVLEGFLTSLLDEKIIVENILESESNKDDREQKSNRVDLKCLDAAGRQIIIEVQSERQADYYERIIWGASKALVESIDSGDKYFKISKIISISILFHDLYFPPENDDYIYSGKTEIKGRHSKKPLLYASAFDADRRVTSGEIFPEFYVICVKNFSDEVRERIDEWVYMFKNEKVEEAFTSPGIAAAQKKLNYLAMSREERQRYDNYLFNASDITSKFATAYDDGRAEGKVEGRAEGIKEGMAEAVRCMAVHMTVQQISSTLGMSEQDVRDIIEKRNGQPAA